MFAPPKAIEAEIFATLPAELRLPNRESAFAADFFPGRPLGSFLEGPSFDRDGNLLVVDIAHGRIFRVSPEGSFSIVADYDGLPNGLKIHRDGRLFVADRQHGILVVDPVNGRVSRHFGAERIPGYLGVNDLFFGADGTLYFTDQGHSSLSEPNGRVFRLTEAGRLDCLFAGVPSPNGLVMDRRENALFVAVTRANAVWRAPVQPDGGIGRVGLFIQLSGGFGPDGLALDRAGNLLIAHAGLGTVWMVSPAGRPLWRIEAGAGCHMTTNLAFGGPENRFLYITSSFAGAILRARLPVAGKAMYAQMP